MEGYGAPATGGSYHWLGAGEERLDRALMAGLMLDAVLAARNLPADPRSQGRALKIQVQETLLSHLSGHITLDRFRSLIHTLERFFPFYLPLLTSLLPQPRQKTSSHLDAGHPAPPASSGSQAVRGALLAEKIGSLGHILPRRPRSKMTGAKLHNFLSQTQGGWFCLRDLQEYFALDRKTAWEYVQKFLQAGLLVHNQAQAAAVRYALADGFLKVQAAAIRREAAAALAGLPSTLAVQVADALISFAGEPFWDEEWRKILPAAQIPEIWERLTAPASLLEVISAAPGGAFLLRLKARWLRSGGG